MLRLVVTLLAMVAAGCGSVSKGGDDAPAGSCVVGSSQIGSCHL
jgi:hypothetical protein